MQYVTEHVIDAVPTKGFIDIKKRAYFSNRIKQQIRYAQMDKDYGKEAAEELRRIATAVLYPNRNSVGKRKY